MKKKDLLHLPKQEDVTKVSLGNGNDGNRSAILDIALSMYENEPCRICGEMITDARKAVYAGYSKGDKARSAHKACWDKSIPQAQWAYPENG